MYSKKTNDVVVSVEPFFLTKQKPDSNQYIWAYRVMIENLRKDKIVIKSRYWYVIDISADFKEVSGDGIVGECPEILPNTVYEYMSGVSINHPFGMMMGHYNVVSDQNDQFKIDIPVFLLESDLSKPVMH